MSTNGDALAARVGFCLLAQFLRVDGMDSEQPASRGHSLFASLFCYHARRASGARPPRLTKATPTEKLASAIPMKK